MRRFLLVIVGATALIGIAPSAGATTSTRGTFATLSGTYHFPGSNPGTFIWYLNKGGTFTDNGHRGAHGVWHLKGTHFSLTYTNNSCGTTYTGTRNANAYTGTVRTNSSASCNPNVGTWSAHAI